MPVVPDYTYEFSDDVLGQYQHVFYYSESYEDIVGKKRQLKFYNIRFSIKKVRAIKQTPDPKNDEVVSLPIHLWLVLTEGIPILPKRDALGSRKANRLKWKLYHLCPEKRNIPCECCPKHTNKCQAYKSEIQPLLEQIERKRMQRHSKSSNEE